MKSFVFITSEGFTFQPNSTAEEPDIENCQVVGFADGFDERNAFENLIKENSYLIETMFDELTVYELKRIANQKGRKNFYIS